MDNEIWQKLRSLEAVDAVIDWFGKLHGRELNSRRAKEITAAARQAREFFRNASNADYSVRPLLIFYGVASLGRVLTLILRKSGGEETLKKGHGLEAVGWSSLLSGEISSALSKVDELKIRTCSGAFTDLVEATQNTTPIHIHSSAVEWRLSYQLLAEGVELSLKDLLQRLPDLTSQYSSVRASNQTATVNDLTYSDVNGFTAQCVGKDLSAVLSSYGRFSYTIARTNDQATVKATPAVFKEQLPLLVHSYIDKSFGAIPRLQLATPYPGNVRISQIGATYILAYYLGMLTRYFPTQWTALMQGQKGDALWPTLNRAIQVTEISFPELVVEFILDELQQRNSQ